MPSASFLGSSGSLPVSIHDSLHLLVPLHFEVLRGFGDFVQAGAVELVELGGAGGFGAEGRLGFALLHLTLACGGLTLARNS